MDPNTDALTADGKHSVAFIVDDNSPIDPAEQIRPLLARMFFADEHALSSRRAVAEETCQPIGVTLVAVPDEALELKSMVSLGDSLSLLRLQGHLDLTYAIPPVKVIAFSSVGVKLSSQG